MTHKLRMLTYLYRVIQLKSRNNYQNKIKKIRKSLEHKSYVTNVFVSDIQLILISINRYPNSYASNDHTPTKTKELL